MHGWGFRVLQWTACIGLRRLFPRSRRRCRFLSDRDRVWIDETKAQRGVGKEAPQSLFGAQRSLERGAAQPLDHIRGEQDLQPRLLGQIIERVRKRFGWNIKGIRPRGLGVLGSRWGR